MSFKKQFALPLLWLCMLPLVQAQTARNQTGEDRAFVTTPTEVITGKKIAFLVGVTEYEDSGSFPTLSFTVKDVKAWQEQLEGIGFEPDNIVVLASNTSVSRRPTKPRILTQLNGLLNKVGKNDIIGDKFVQFEWQRC